MLNVILLIWLHAEWHTCHSLKQASPLTWMLIYICVCRKIYHIFPYFVRWIYPTIICLSRIWNRVCIKCQCLDSIYFHTYLLDFLINASSLYLVVMFEIYMPEIHKRLCIEGFWNNKYTFPDIFAKFRDKWEFSLLIDYIWSIYASKVYKKYIVTKCFNISNILSLHEYVGLIPNTPQIH